VKDNLVDVRLSEKRDMEAAKAFFAQVDEKEGRRKRFVDKKAVI